MLELPTCNTNVRGSSAHKGSSGVAQLERISVLSTYRFGKWVLAWCVSEQKLFVGGNFPSRFKMVWVTGPVCCFSLLFLCISVVRAVVSGTLP